MRILRQVRNLWGSSVFLNLIWHQIFKKCIKWNIYPASVSHTESKHVCIMPVCSDLWILEGAHMYKSSLTPLPPLHVFNNLKISWLKWLGIEKMGWKCVLNSHPPLWGSTCEQLRPLTWRRRCSRALGRSWWARCTEGHTATWWLLPGHTARTKWQGVKWMDEMNRWVDQ